MSNSLLKAFTRCFDATDLATRGDYVIFVAPFVIFAVIIKVLDRMPGFYDSSIGGFVIIFSLYMTFSLFVITVKRLHDVGDTGWKSLIILIPIVGTIFVVILCCKKSKLYDNEYRSQIKNNSSNFNSHQGRQSYSSDHSNTTNDYDAKYRHSSTEYIDIDPRSIRTPE